MPFRRRLPRRSLGEGGCPAPRITTSYCDFMAACLHQTSQSKHQTFLCGKTYAYGMRERLQAFICKTTRVAAGDIDAMLNNERDASSRRTDLLRVCDCDGGGTKRDNVTFSVSGGSGDRSSLDCGDTRFLGTSSVG